jgi:RNA polymerase sigma factor (TIGR02999 family)
MDPSGTPDDLMAALYDELHAIAAAQLREQRSGHTLQPTALVNEAYLRLRRGHPAVQNREDFLRLACSVMRNLLVDHARARKSAKRGGAWQRITLSAAHDDSASTPVDVLALDEALTELSAFDERVARLVELRFFGGLGESEAAEMLGVSRAAATRDWRMARAWLAQRLRNGETTQ